MNEYIEQLKEDRKQLNQEWAYLAGSKDSYAIRRLAEIKRELIIIGDDLRTANENAPIPVSALSTFKIEQLPTAILADISRSAK